MNEAEQQKLEEIIQRNNVQDNTKKIQKLKHSDKIRKDVAQIRNVKRRIKTKDFRRLDSECSRHCVFLYRHYPNIYNKLLKDEIDIQILYKFLDALEAIEKGEKTQHEASYDIGMLLRKLYVEKKVDIHNDPNKPKDKKTRQNNRKGSKVSYADFKKMNE